MHNADVVVEKILLRLLCGDFHRAALVEEILLQNGDFSRVNGDLPEGWRKEMWLTDAGVSLLSVDENGKVKDYILQLLKDKYGMEEEDFLSSELVAVPAGTNLLLPIPLINPFADI